MPIAHDLLFFHPDIETQPDHVDVGHGRPLRAGVRAIRIAEGDVNAGKFFVLQDIADHLPYANVRANGELADTIRVFVGMRVSPEIVAQLAVLRAAVNDAVLPDFNSQGRCLQQTIFKTKIVAHHPIDDKGSVDFAWSGEDFTSG